MNTVRRRRFPWWLLVIAFVVVPLIEIWTIISIGTVIGAWWTIGLLVADSIFGSWLIKREGGRAWRALRSALNSGRMPATELSDAALILIAGTLMLTPGFVTDLVGLFCVLPFTRPIARRALTRVVARKLTGVPGSTAPSGFAGFSGFPEAAAGGQRSTGQPGQPGQRHRPGPEVVQGDVVD